MTSTSQETRSGLSAGASSSNSMAIGGSPVGSDSGYTSGARTPQPGRGAAEDPALPSAADWSPAGSSISASPRPPAGNQHQRKRSSVSIPSKLTSRTGPRRIRAEPPDNTLNTTTRQELTWDDSSSAESAAFPIAADQPHHFDPAQSAYTPPTPPTASAYLDNSRPPSVISSRPPPKRRGTLGYVVSSSSRSSSINGQLPDSAASSLSSHHSSPRSPSVHGLPTRQRQRTTSGWTTNSQPSAPVDVPSFQPVRSLSLTPGNSVAGSPIPHSPLNASSLAASASDRSVEDGTTLLTLYKDLLSAIASKQRTCAELRHELEREEADLRELQRLWEAQVQRELAAQAQGGAVLPALPTDIASAKGITKPNAISSPGSTLSSRPQLGTLAAASRSNENLPPTPSATDTFRKLLGNWGISTPSITTPSASKQNNGSSNSYFPLASSAGASKVPYSQSSQSSASSSASSSPHNGTPLEGLSDDEAQLLNQFQPRDLDKEREQARQAQRLGVGKKQNDTGVILPLKPASGLGPSIEVTGEVPITVVGQQLERSGNRTPTPNTIGEALSSLDTEVGTVEDKGRKSSIVSEASDIQTPKIKSSARMFFEDATPTNGRDTEKAKAKAAKSAAESSRSAAVGPGRKTGQGFGGDSVLFPRRTGESVASSSSSIPSSRTSSSVSSTIQSSTSGSSSSTVREAPSSSHAGTGPRSPPSSSLPSWGAKRFSMLGESISAFSAKVEEQFALAAAAAASTASADSPPPPSDAVSARRKAAPSDVPRDLSQKEGVRTSMSSDTKSDESTSGLTSTFGAWSTKRLKEAGEFLATAERSIGNALIMDDPSPSNGFPKRQSGSMPMGSGDRKNLLDNSRPGSSQNGNGDRSSPLSEGLRKQSLLESEAEREREALRQFGRRDRPQSPPSAPSSQHTRTSSILSSMGGGVGEAGSSSSHSHRRSLSLGLGSRPGSILSSAEAGVSSLFGMLSNALTVPPDEGEEEHAEEERGDNKKNVMDY
ncbi:hypothetical protein CF319_g814 [Tilletia indica]|nr:hypothetical protein CF319_g814 [Tilletia indica]